MPPTPILLDTDIGTDVDDAITLALALASPELDLRAVTTVSGDTGLRARIAARLLALGGRGDVPVAAGVREPILRQRSFLWLGHEGRGIVDAGESVEIAAGHGVDVFIETVLREQPHVVAIGPLSNLVAIMKTPEVIAAIPHLTVMGGSLGRHAEVPAFEYNLGSDAEAAVVVLSAGIPTTLVPLDVTLRAVFTTADLARLRRCSSPLLRAVCDAVEIWAPIQRSFFESSPAFSEDVVSFLHDPLTLAILLDPTLVRLERLALRPAVVDGGFRLIEERGALPFEVAVDVDVERAAPFVLERLLSLI